MKGLEPLLSESKSDALPPWLHPKNYFYFFNEDDGTLNPHDKNINKF